MTLKKMFNVLESRAPRMHTFKFQASDNRCFSEGIFES